MSNAKAQVLIVEDEPEIAELIEFHAERAGMRARKVHSGRIAIDVIKREKPDLIVLDLMLPDLDGLEACRQIRTFTDAYVIMLTARDDETDKVVALSVGADDYIVKPFSPRELIARTKAMLRRPRTPAEPEPVPALHVGGLVVDPDARTVTVDGSPVELTRTEFDILAALAARPKSALNRAQIIEHVWGGEWYGDEHVVDVHVGHLRRKLGDDANEPRFVRTVRGVGYGMGPG